MSWLSSTRRIRSGSISMTVMPMPSAASWRAMVVPTCPAPQTMIFISTHGIQEMHVAMVLVEHVVDHVLLAPAHDVVVLSALAQVDLGAEEPGFLVAAAPRILQHEGRRLVRARMHRVEEIRLLAVADPDPDPAVLA